MHHRIKSRKRSGLLGLGRLLLVLIGLFVLFVAVDRSNDRRVAESDLMEQLSQGMHTQEVEGLNLAYRDVGSGDDVVLMIHGLMGSSDNFTPLLPWLSPGRRVISIDLIGFGLSDKEPTLDYSKANMARLCGLLMETLGFEHYAVVGHSMGGEVAMQLATQSPDAIDRLVLISSAGYTDLQRGFSGQLPEGLIAHVGQNYLVQRLYFLFALGDPRQATGTLFDRFYAYNRHIPAQTIQKMILDNDSGALNGSLSSLTQPALIIWGQKDRIIPIRQGRLLHEALADSRWLELAGVGHLPMSEAPQVVGQAVDAFLSDH